MLTYALRFVTKFLFPPLLDTLSDFPRVAEASVALAFWGIRIAKTVLAAMLAGMLTDADGC